jgi:hypothetical protein
VTAVVAAVVAALAGTAPMKPVPARTAASTVVTAVTDSDRPSRFGNLIRTAPHPVHDRLVKNQPSLPEGSQ